LVRHIEAQEMGNIDGTWEGDLSVVHGPGLQAPDYPPQRWRFVIQGDSARAFILRDGKVQEIVALTSASAPGCGPAWQ
jgi:hypothetical protein